MKTSLLTVIVPVYKVEEYLPRCVDSILGQTYENLEVILVDDGSPDGSGAICDAYAARDSRVKVIHKENGGLSSARNAGIDAARGEYLAFVDSDDWIEPDAYESMMALMERCGVKLVCGGRYDVDGETGTKTLGLCPEKEEKISSEELAGRIFRWDHCDSSACDKLYHRSLLNDFRYPEGKTCEDVPVTYRIILQEPWAAMLPKPVYNYCHRPGSITTSGVSEKTFDFSRHTAAIYGDIRANHPDIAPQARYLRVKSLSHILLVLEKAPGAKKTFRDPYRQARRELKQHASFLFRTPWLGKQEKLTDLLLILGLYGPFQRFYHFFKRSEP